MTRKVSSWIVVALVGALAAMTAAVLILATHDRVEGRTARGLSPADGWSHGWPDTQGDRRLPVIGEMRGGWDGGRDAPILPWVLFAVSTGTAVGLLVAWRRWRTAPVGPRHTDRLAGGTGGAVLPAKSVATTPEERSADVAEAQTTEETGRTETTEEAGETPRES